ncbi:hypothetical protein IFM89_004138 [Coptis chinensis]|uniref:ABC transporter C family member 3 n=1 Tax=Coptis chinensis TaxID=261450 RepID=A0A835H191_9MAGN|nr:hypothetical protein IFM89_004138 [Coptis chinensis]
METPRRELNAVFAGINTFASYTGPFLITSFVDFLSRKQDGSSHRYGFTLAFYFFFAQLVDSLSQRQWYFGAQRIGFRARASVMVLIYSKALKMKNYGSSTGKIVNFINVDVERIKDFSSHVHGIWLLPVQVALLNLYRSLGCAPSIAALFATVLVMVSNSPLVRIQEKLESKIMEAKDSRMKATSETLKSMRVLKLHSWETTFLKKILERRQTVRSWLKRYHYLRAAVVVLFWISPTLVSAITFGVCVLVKTPLISGTVLSALTTFRILQEPMYNLPELISAIAQTKVSVDRINDFIREENQEYLTLDYAPNTSSVSIEIASGEFSWETGEIPWISGMGVMVYGSKAYVPQSAWIQTGTVRENVLFGNEMKKHYYKDVLKACALNRDIDMWANGDLSVVEERGTNLSGGQQQRIQLARAIYRFRCILSVSSFRFLGFTHFSSVGIVKDEKFVEGNCGIEEERNELVDGGKDEVECGGVAEVEAVVVLFWISPTLVSVVTFGVCVLVRTPLTSGTVLSALATFRILQEPIYNLPELISAIAQMKVSVDRINDFIREENQEYLTLDYAPNTSSVSTEIASGEFSWETGNAKGNKPTIKIAKDLKIMKGSKIAVSGMVGSGKSSFLCSILGEIPWISGMGVKVYWSKAYVPQSAWIQTSTVRENVLFGKEMKKCYYKDVLKACALNRDIDMWANGDLSVVGERGTNLSGGQQQRIQLARAIYSDSDVYLLDDRFSAVDAHTKAHLFQECVMQFLAQKTIIYVTHQLEFLDASDLVLVIKDGSIVQSGKYEDLIANPYGELVRQMSAHRQSLSQIGSNYWIASATKEESVLSKKKLIGVFVLLSGGSSIFVLGRAVLLATISIETAQTLFLGMINSVFRAPVLFFDSTPSSQILNRSSTDQSTVDTDIPYKLVGLVFALVQLLSIMLLMSYIAWQIFLIFLTILAISIWYQAYYITAARELARMAGTSKSPIVHHFSESIAGAATIRCFNQEAPFFAKIQKLIDDYSHLTFYSSATMEWLSVRINFLFNLVFLSALLILVTLPREAIDPSMAGLIATYGLSLNVIQGWVIWNICNVDNKMISVERILQFSSIQSEAPLTIVGCTPDPDWLMSGTIDIDNLHVQYSPSLRMILKGITCTFPGTKKVGVVGRTGSGKSTLIQTLFRVVEPSNGKTLIDGVDIGKLGLKDLRSRLSIVPQNPTLFEGTMRTNLDPLKQHSDTEIWEVLNKCNLREIVRQDERLLNAPVATDGENWSVGQRQLICLARVLLSEKIFGVG